MKVFTVGALCLMSAFNTHAEDTKFMEFALKQAHKVGFHGCDASIRTAFSSAVGNDIHVTVDYFDETLKDSIKISATWGSLGDSVYFESEIRKYSGKCYVTSTGVITAEKSCTAQISEMKDYKYITENADFIYTKNDRGSSMIMKQLNGSCISIFHQAHSLTSK